MHQIIIFQSLETGVLETKYKTPEVNPIGGNIYKDPSTLVKEVRIINILKQLLIDKYNYGNH